MNTEQSTTITNIYLGEFSFNVIAKKKLTHFIENCNSHSESVFNLSHNTKKLKHFPSPTKYKCLLQRNVLMHYYKPKVSLSEFDRFGCIHPKQTNTQQQNASQTLKLLLQTKMWKNQWKYFLH